MESPYLVKRFISKDKVPGASTFYYWMYAPQDNTEKSGLGEFFEVVSTEVDEKTCEYISKRVWESFVEKYTSANFEQALQKASFSLISVLRELQIEQIDINFAFWALKEKEEKKYLLELAIIGQADVILVRDSKPIFLHEYAPANEDLKNLKYVELDIESKDKILVSNRFLLENLLKTDVLDLATDYSLLESLKEAEGNFPGGQGVFMLGIDIQKDLEIKSAVNHQSSNKARFDSTQGAATSSKKVALHAPENHKTLADILNDFKKRIFQKFIPISDAFKSNLSKIIGSKKKKTDLGKTYMRAGKSLGENGHKNITAITSDLSKYISETEDNLLKTSEEKKVAEESKEAIQKESEGNISQLESPNVLRLKRIWWGRFYLAVSKLIRPVFSRRKHRALYVDGNLAVRKTPFKLKIVYLLGVVFISFLVFNLIKSYHNKKEERRQTTVFVQKEILPVIKMYNEQVKPIELTDPDHILDLCIKTVNKTLNEIEHFNEKLGYIENKEKVSSYISQLKEIKNQCSAKYDKVHHIVRIKNATVVKDFAADLGAEVDIVSIVEQKGYVYAVDRGKKAVYRINPDTGRAIKLEDPDGLLRDPVEIGVNKDHILVCDRISGILEFRDNKFNAIVGTSPEALGSKCMLVRGFYANAYFVLDDKSKLYKSAGVDSGYALPVVYVKNIKEVLDVAIDGNIYVLRKVGETVKLERYFQGVLDNSFRFKEDLTEYTKLYTNPSGNFPIYVFSPSKNTILVIEKPTARKHPGYGVVLKRIILDNEELFGSMDDFAINLGIDSNKEEYLYFVGKNVLWKVGLQGK